MTARQERDRFVAETAGVTAVVGDFADPAELYKLDAYHDIDLLTHLAAVTGGCSEEDGIRSVNNFLTPHCPIHKIYKET